MAGILRSVVRRPPGRLQTATKGVEPLVCTDWIRHKFTRSRIPDETVNFWKKRIDTDVDICLKCGKQ